MQDINERDIYEYIQNEFPSGKKLLFILVLIIIFPSIPCTAQSVETERNLLDHLDECFLLLKQQTASNRLLIGGSFFGAGLLTGLITVPFFIEDGSGANIGEISVFNLGGSALLTACIGLVLMVIPTHEEVFYNSFVKIPENNNDEVIAKLMLGEKEIKKMAEDSKISRFIGGGVLTAAGCGVILSGVIREAFDIPVFSMAGFFLSGGIALFYIETLQELKYREFLSIRGQWLMNRE